MSKKTIGSQGLILLASAQLWPNIQSFVNYKDSLSHLCIYHTNDGVYSRSPAIRLKKLCEELSPHVNIHLPQDATSSESITPQAVTEQIQQWQRDITVDEWIINATGGTKLMFAGALGGIQSQNTNVLYRELRGQKGQWYTLRLEDGYILSDSIEFDESGTKELSVCSLIEAQMQGSEVFDVDLKIPQKLDTSALLTKGSNCGWDWVETFESENIEIEQGKQRQGFLFESFIASVLWTLGVEKLASNIEISKDGQKTQEVDLVANHKGRLLLFDCKLRAKEEEKQGHVESMIKQIQHAAHTCRNFGGLGAKMILIRPNWQLSETEHALCEANRLKIIDAKSAWMLLSELASFVGEELSENLQTFEKELQEQKALGVLRAYCQEPRWTEEYFINRGNRVILKSLSNEKCKIIKQYKDILEQDWAILREQEQDQHFTLSLSSPHKYPSPIHDVAQIIVEWGGKEPKSKLSNSGKTLTCHFQVPEDSFTTFVERLTKRLRNSFLESSKVETSTKNG